MADCLYWRCFRWLTTGCRARSTSLWVCRNLFCQLSRDGNLHGSGISHAMTASKKSILQGTLEGRQCCESAEEMLDGQHQRVDISAHARTAHKSLLQKRLEKDLCWIIPNASPPSPQNHSIGQGTELNLRIPDLVLLPGRVRQIKIPPDRKCSSLVVRGMDKTKS